MDHRRAVADGVIARVVVAVVGVRLTPGERAEYDGLTAELAATRARLIGRHRVPAEPVGAFLDAVARLARGGEDEAAGVARRHLRALQERKGLLAETPVKQAALRALMPVVAAAERTLVFTHTIHGAEVAAAAARTAGVAAAAVHSQMTRPQRFDVLDRFGDGRLALVAAPQVLDEGIDVPAADLAVILAGSRSRRQMVQRMGRILRRKPDGRRARFVVVAAEGTVEDPRLGAHAEFLAALAGVADEVRQFPASTATDEIATFLTAGPTNDLPG